MLKSFFLSFQDGVEDSNSCPSFQQISLEICFHLEVYQVV